MLKSIRKKNPNKLEKRKQEKAHTLIYM